MHHACHENRPRGRLVDAFTTSDRQFPDSIRRVLSLHPEWPVWCLSNNRNEEEKYTTRITSVALAPWQRPVHNRFMTSITDSCTSGDIYGGIADSYREVSIYLELYSAKFTTTIGNTFSDYAQHIIIWFGIEQNWIFDRNMCMTTVAQLVSDSHTCKVNLAGRRNPTITASTCLSVQNKIQPPEYFSAATSCCPVHPNSKQWSK